MKIKKFIIALIISLITLVYSGVAYAVPQVLFTTNGAAKQYASGAVLLVRGWVGENKVGLSDIPVLVVAQNGSNTIYSSQAYADTSGFFTTNFNLGANDKAGDTINISVHAANTTKEDSVTISSQPKAFQFMGSSLKLASAKGTLIPQPAPSDIALVFNSNVNFFNDNAWPVVGLPDGVNSFLGLNERNQDCISLYNEDTGARVDAYVQVGDSESNYGLYYPLNSTEQTDKDSLGDKVITNKNVLHLIPAGALKGGTTYRIEIDKDLSANSSASLGQTQTAYFKTEASSSAGGGPISTPATQAQDIANIQIEGQKAVVAVDAQKALERIKDQTQTALSIDLSAVGTGDTKQKSVQLPQEVVAAAQAQNKDIVLQDAGLAIVIPADALAANQAVTISTQQVEGKNVPAPVAGLSNPTVYQFNAGQNDQSGYQFKQDVKITLTIPAGVVNPERLSVYYLNDTTGQWEYVGGRIVDGKLVFQTSHFSKYMLAESTKTFSDISSHWCKNTIEVMLARQVVSGVNANEFAPDRNITRAEFATLLTRVLKLTEKGSDQTFSDVAQTDWYADYVCKAAKIGAINGYAGQFRPNDLINRQEMATMAMNAYKYKNGKLDSSNELTFVDKDNISPWAMEAVKGAYNIGVIKGRGAGEFAPLEKATRAEATVMLKSFMDKLGL
ncbi:MAG: S-layer homology domain-containing protein [Syntrophomonas sp.]